MMINNIYIVCLLFIATFPGNVCAQTATERRQAYLKEIQTFNIGQRFRENTRRVSLQDSTWDDWLKRTGELPPDFAQLPSAPFLPEPLVQVRNGKEIPITTPDEWNRKREEIKTAYQHWVSGRFPPAPDNLTAEVLSDKTEDSGTRIQLIQLRFGPDRQATMTVELIIPPGNGPFPVFMTQWNHREWAQLAVKRGYIGCVYAAADNKDDTEQYLYLYPEYDFSALMRRAWGASRVVDYLQTRGEVDKNQISLSGHSRNGKQSLWAAAFDDRIAAVVSSSSSTGGDAPWRLGDPQYASETLDYVTALNGHWFHPRLRFFFGREDKLPVDQNLLAALIAPRALLFHYSVVERGLNSWANEQNYYSVKKVYDFLQAPDAVGVHTRMGEHAVAARDIEATIDFLDIQFGRSTVAWNNVLYYPYRFSDWATTPAASRAAATKPAPVRLKEYYDDMAAFQKDREAILRNLNWLLGDEPGGARAVKTGTWDSPRQDWMDKINPRPVVKGATSIHIGPYTSIGDHVEGRLYCPADAAGNIQIPPGGKFPVIIYSHQYAYSTGYAKGYDKDGRPGTADLFEELIGQGFAVLTIDLFGFGTRIEEATRFYERHPQWSKMGKMVRDLRSCIDAAEELEYLDNNRIYLLGNTIGGAVSLITAALDQRVAGVAVVAAVSPWRTSDSQYESLRTYSHFHGFLPRLGLFADHPQQAPVDFGEIIAAAAPKPMLIIAPDRDRYTNNEALRSMMTPVNNLYRFYGKPAPLAIQYPREINRMTPEMYREAGTFLRGLAEKADTADQPFSYNRHFDDQSKTYYYLTRIKHKDRQGNIIPLRHAHAASDSGETVLEFAKRMNTVLAFNASTQRSPKPGLRKPNGVQIVDGVIIQELPSSAHTLGIKRDNTLVAYPSGTRAADMLKDGVVQALTAFMPLIENHVPASEAVLALRNNSVQKHPRQVIAQFDNRDILFLSCGGRGFDGEGMTAADVIRILKALNVRFAYNLDGGGSTSTVVGDELITVRIDGKGTQDRPRPNFLYVEKK